MAKEKARIALATQGTRGDFQPVLALGIGLARAGHSIIFFGNPDHVKTAREFDFEAVAVSLEIKDLLATERGRKAMEAGDLIAIGSSEKFDDDDVLESKDDTDWQGLMDEALDRFKPDLLLYTGLIGAMVNNWISRNPNVPTLLAAYQPHAIPTNSIGPIMMQRLETDPDMPLFYRWVMTAQFEATSAHARGEDRKKEGKEPNYFDSPAAVWDFNFELDKQPAPLILAYSAEWWPAYPDWPKKGFEITGNWKIPKAEQEERAAKGGAFFDAGGQHEACVNFIQKGTKPVYIGWGSMMVYSKGHMARLAVGALKEAGQRGIVVGGWAQLSEESLDGAEDSEVLKAYAKDNVLFLKAAPHEWLFPQCACAVHHGGIGTAQASLSAGVPTVVTPVFADQSDIAAKVNADRHGVGTRHLSKVTPAELGDAIRRCCTDEDIKARVKDLSERMQKEDGVGRTVEIIEKFIFETVRSGEWERLTMEKLKRLKEKEELSAKGSLAQVFGQWQMDLSERFPVMKAFTEKQLAQTMACMGLLKEKKLWWVCAESGCLAREGEGLKTPEAGRYKEFALLQEISVKGNRLQVKRVKGVGPETGWVSSTVSGKDIVKKVENTLELKRIQFEAINKPFQDVAQGGGPALKSMGMAK